MAPASTQPELDPRLVKHLQDLQGLLRAVVRRLLPGDHGARSLGRFLGVDRMTGWQCWTLVQEETLDRVIRAMPGRRGWDRILTGLEARGATGSELAAIRREIRAFEAYLGQRNLDWTNLADARVDERDAAAEEIAESRRLASEGAIALYGVKSRLLLVSYIIAPGSGADLMNLGSLGLVDGMQRTRSGDPWPIVQRPVIEEAGEARFRHRPCGDSPELPSLITGLSSPDIDREVLRRERFGDLTETITYTGDAASADQAGGGHRICFGDCVLDLPFDAPASDGSSSEQGSFQLVTTFLNPARLAVLELLVHPDFSLDADPAISLVGTPLGPENLAERHRARLLPIETGCRPVTESALPRRFGPIARARTAGLRRVGEAMGCRPSEFATFRLELPHPPVFASAVMTIPARLRAR